MYVMQYARTSTSTYYPPLACTVKYLYTFLEMRRDKPIQDVRTYLYASFPCTSLSLQLHYYLLYGGCIYNYMILFI